MGFRLHYDGRCCVCKTHCVYFCDHCGRYVCDEHWVKKPIPNTFKKFLFCPDCAKKNKKVVTPKRKMCNTGFDFYVIEGES